MSIDFRSNVHQNNLKGVKSSYAIVYEFEDYRLDAAHLMLYRLDEEISLPPKQVETLLALVERGGEIVSKEDLIERLWANAFVEESNLIQNIYVLRKVLGETADGKPLIETLRRRGYRFNGELKINGHRQSEIAVKTRLPLNYSSETERGKSEETPDFKMIDKKRPIFVLAAAAFLITVLGFGFYKFSSSKILSPEIKSIAVLPVKPINAGIRDELYEIGIADALINRLGMMKGFYVRPLDATRKYSDIAQDPLAAGREQQTDYVLASNYQIADGRIRLTAQLYNVRSGQIEETYKIEKDAGGVFAVQDAIANEVGNLLKSRFVTTIGDSMAKRGTSNEEAYRLYLQGTNMRMKRNLADFKKSVEYFEHAIRLDPNYASAYAGLAGAKLNAEVSNVNTARGVDEKARSVEKIKEILAKALELNPNLAEAYAVRADLEFLYHWNLDQAEKDLLRAIELEPNNDQAHWLYSLVLAYRGRFDEAFKEVETAQNIYPGALMYMRDRGRYLYYTRRYTEAIEQFKRVIELDEGFVTAYNWLVRSYELKGDYDEAFRVFIKRQQKANPERAEIFQKAFEIGGWQAVRRKQRELNKTSAESSDAYFELARHAAFLGEKDQAFEFLEKAIEQRDWQIIMLNVEPMLDNLRDDSRFDGLVRRAGLSK